MDALNKLLQDLGISKVKLAKYLGVSRQMVYNYLTFEDINNWPKEKKALLFQLLEIDSSSFKGFDKIKNEPIIKDVETSWETVEIYDERNILAKNKNGELKRFLIE